MMVILLFTPCTKDKIVFPDLIFLFWDFRYKKGITISLSKTNLLKNPPNIVIFFQKASFVLIKFALNVQCIS